MSKRKVPTVKPQHAHDWKLVIKHGDVGYYNGGCSKPGLGWTTGLWSAKKFENMHDVRLEMKEWDRRDVPGDITICRVWICEGEVRAKTRVGEGLSYQPLSK